MPNPLVAGVRRGPFANPMPKIKTRPTRPSHSIPRATFARTVREIAGDFKPDVRWSAGALAALQDDAEQLLAERFRRASGLLADFKHKTVGTRVFQIAGAVS